MLANPNIAVSVVRCDTNRFSYSCAAWRSFLFGVPMLRGDQHFHFCSTSAVKLHVFASFLGIGFPCCVALVFSWRPHAAWESIFSFLQHLCSDTACFCFMFRNRLPVLRGARFFLASPCCVGINIFIFATPLQWNCMFFWICAIMRLRARACACVRACVRLRARVCAGARMRAHACACVRLRSFPKANQPDFWNRRKTATASAFKQCSRLRSPRPSGLVFDTRETCHGLIFQATLPFPKGKRTSFWHAGNQPLLQFPSSAHGYIP